jgi:hypothetical protein
MSRTSMTYHETSKMTIHDVLYGHMANRASYNDFASGFLTLTPTLTCRDGVSRVRVSRRSNRASKSLPASLQLQVGRAATTPADRIRTSVRQQCVMDISLNGVDCGFAQEQECLHQVPGSPSRTHHTPTLTFMDRSLHCTRTFARIGDHERHAVVIRDEK